MVDSMQLPDSSTDSACPWCSAAVTPETATCPSCNAILKSEEERDLPGITTVDATIARGEKRPVQRSRFLAWLGGEAPDSHPSTPLDAQAIARPDDDVQREILRLELEAHISNLQAEADSILSDALVEGRVADIPDGLRPLAAAEGYAETPQETADKMVAAAMANEAEAEAAVTADIDAAEDAEAATTDTDAEASETDQAN